MPTTEKRKSSVNLTPFLCFQAVNSASFESFEKIPIQKETQESDSWTWNVNKCSQGCGLQKKMVPGKQQFSSDNGVFNCCYGFSPPRDCAVILLVSIWGCCLLLLWCFCFDLVGLFQGSNGSRKSSFDSPGGTEEEAGGGEGAGLKQVGPWEECKTNRQTALRNCLLKTNNQFWEDRQSTFP